MRLPMLEIVISSFSHATAISTSSVVFLGGGFFWRRLSLVLMLDWILAASLKVQIPAVGMTFPDRLFHHFFCLVVPRLPTAMRNNTHVHFSVFLCPLPIIQEMEPNNVWKNQMISSEDYTAHRDSLAPHCPQILIFFLLSHALLTQATNRNCSRGD